VSSSRKPNSVRKPQAAQTLLLYHFCRMQLPGVNLSTQRFEQHLEHCFSVYQGKTENNCGLSDYLQRLYPLDVFLSAACLEGDAGAWDHLFASRSGRSDCLLVDALRARALRLYPRDEERQESAITEFWSNLLVAEREDSQPILARYDGQRPLVPWLIRVFQNWHISQLRQRGRLQPLPEDDIALPLPAEPDTRWQEAFRTAAQTYIKELPDGDLLILGLRMRYRMSQREIANLLGVHEGTISRQTSQLRDRCLEAISKRLLAQGWTGDDLSRFVLSEMGSLLLDEPRLSADRLAALLAARGKELPATAADSPK
jgi:RNA polymerase sigma factor (sigma-70 family)